MISSEIVAAYAPNIDGWLTSKPSSASASHVRCPSESAMAPARATIVLEII